MCIKFILSRFPTRRLSQQGKNNSLKTNWLKAWGNYEDIVQAEYNIK